MDNAVLATQQWLNATYGSRTGWVHVNEDGLTGWNVIYGLTRALQVELGITTLNQNFGAQTEAQLTSKYPIITAQSTNVPANIVKVIQGAMYSKGFNGAGAANGNTITLDGVFGSQLTASVNTLRTNMGLGAGGVTVRIFKALLNMDAFVLVSGGDATIRQIQQSWNGRYQTRSAFDIIPTDGRYSRPIQRALMYAIQYELGMDDATANGNFGNLTKSGLRSSGNFGSGSASNYLIRLFQAALRFNGYPTAYDGAFGSSTATTTRQFQEFVGLPASGRSDFSTWASLLVSTGDVDRAATGVDCVTTINSLNGPLLYSRGYRVVGRYLTNLPSLDKNIKPGEIGAIFNAGLRIFPIFQTYGGTPSQFTEANGRRDAKQAYDAAIRYGFHAGKTTIYFAVDWDAIDSEITSRVIPYFRGVNAWFGENRAAYGIGIYGARNICSRVSAAGLAELSFVSDMSTGYSGNLGYPLPSNWAIDQIQTVTVSGNGTSIEIDRNVLSGRDVGQSAIGNYRSQRALNFSAYHTPRGRPVMQVRDLIRQSIDEWAPTATDATRVALIRQNLDSTMLSLEEADQAITAVSAQLNMRKSLIQCILVWESSMINVTDDFADQQVAYSRQVDTGVIPAVPPPYSYSNDSSTGIAQIFAWVAIKAQNWFIDQGLLGNTKWNAGNKEDVWAVWSNLKTDKSFNITWATRNLYYEIRKTLNVSGDLLDLTDAQAARFMSQYQTSGTTDTSYGDRLVPLLHLFDQWGVEFSS